MLRLIDRAYLALRGTLVAQALDGLQVGRWVHVVRLTLLMAK